MKIVDFPDHEFSVYWMVWSHKSPQTGVFVSLTSTDQQEWIVDNAKSQFKCSLLQTHRQNYHVNGWCLISVPF